MVQLPKSLPRIVSLGVTILSSAETSQEETLTMAVPILVQSPQPNLGNGEGSSAAKTARGEIALPQAVALCADTYVAIRGMEDLYVGD